MKDIIEINFTDTGHKNAIRFTVTNYQNKKVWVDTVRFSDWQSTSSWPAREALSPYGFWLDLKAFVGDQKPYLRCDNLDLLKHYFDIWRQTLSASNDPWPFHEPIEENAQAI